MMRLPIVIVALLAFVPGCPFFEGIEITSGTGAPPGSSGGGEASGTTGASDSGGSTGAGTSTTDETDSGAGGCADDDPWEPNNAPEEAAALVWDSINMWASYITIDAFLCADDSDWYHVPVEALDYEFYALHLDAIVEGSSWCPYEFCEQPALPSAPEHAIEVEVYDAATLELLNSNMSDSGRVSIKGWGAPYAKDLLVRVYGPTPAATYNYGLYVEIRGYDGEDECEC